MKKNIFLGLISIIGVFCLLVVNLHKNNSVLAAATTGTELKTKPISRCLKTTYCNLPENCVIVSGHRVQLETDTSKAPLRANHKTYINECFSYVPPGETKNKNVCTTGDSDLDKELHGIDNFSKIQADLGYKLEDISKVVTQPSKTLFPLYDVAAKKATQALIDLKTDAFSNIPVVEWQDYTPVSHSRTWLAFQLVTENTAIRTKEGGEQQAELDFLEDPQACVPFGWDPDGRTFDSVTLDPIPGATVKLLKKNETTGAWEDPAIPGRFKMPTAVDGKYGYDVLNGDYKIVVTPPLNYTFPLLDISKINPNYKKVYINPLSTTPGSTASATRIYPAQTGEIVKVFNAPEHADLPLKPNKASGYQYKNVKVEFIEQRQLSGDVIIQGESSHPFTKIKIYVAPVGGSGTGQYFKTFTSKYDGSFSFVLEQQSLPEGTRYSRADFQASDLTKPLSQESTSSKLATTWLAPEVQAQDGPVTSVGLHDIPAYLEGYAYNNGKTLSNATVGVYLTFSNISSHEVKTDDKGYFKITSEFLPVMPYELRYTSATGETIKVSPETFMVQNAKYLADSKVSIYKYKNAQGTDKPPFFATRPSAQETPGGTVNALTPQPTIRSTNPLFAGSSGQTMMILLILIVLLGVVGTVLVLQLLKKNQQPPLPPQSSPPVSSLQ